MSILYGKPFQLEAPSTDRSHVIVNANAGSGKTTSLVQAIWRLLSINKHLWIKGTPEQDELWERIRNLFPSKLPSEIRVVSFANKNVDDFKAKLTKGNAASSPKVKVSTVHSYGLSILTQANIGPRREWINMKKGNLLLSDAYDGESINQIGRKFKGLPKLARRVIDLMKANELSVDAVRSEEQAYDTITSIMFAQGISADSSTIEELSRILPSLYEAHFASHTRMIDAGDMLWLPRMLGLTKNCRGIPLIFGDEAQDFNVCQRNIVLDTAESLVVVGDTRQAIYAFQGADTNSFEKFHKALSVSPKGVVSLGLTTSFRCPKCVLPLVTPIVPNFKVSDSAIEGEISILKWRQMIESPENLLSKNKNTLFIGRRNAYLLPVAIKLVAKGVACSIVGREFGEELADILLTIADNDASLSCCDILPLIDKWHSNSVETAIAAGQDETALTLIVDKAECLTAICSRNLSVSVSSACDFITQLFQDNDTSKVLLASIHRGKGLEADSVIFLAYDAVPDPNCKQGSPIYEQEWNMVYVACTRTQNRLYLVTQPDEKKALSVAPNHPVTERAKKFQGTVIAAEVQRAEAATARVETGESIVLDMSQLRLARLQEAIERIRSMTDEEIEEILNEMERMKCRSHEFAPE